MAPNACTQRITLPSKKKKQEGPASAGCMLHVHFWCLLRVKLQELENCRDWRSSSCVRRGNQPGGGFESARVCNGFLLLDAGCSAAAQPKQGARSASQTCLRDLKAEAGVAGAAGSPEAEGEGAPPPPHRSSNRNAALHAMDTSQRSKLQPSKPHQATMRQPSRVTAILQGNRGTWVDSPRFRIKSNLRKSTQAMTSLRSGPVL